MSLPTNYTSSKADFLKPYPTGMIKNLDMYVMDMNRMPETYGQLQDILLAYRWHGQRLLIHHLEPIFRHYIKELGFAVY